MKAIRTLMALLLALTLVSTALPFAIGEEELEADGLRQLRLGNSFYTVMIDRDFMPGDLTEEDIEDGQIAYYLRGEDGLDFDLYQFGKEDAAQDLDHYTLQEADEYDGVKEVRPADSINGIEVGWYRTTEEWEGEDYETLTFILDNVDTYVELVFWMDDAADEEEAWAIMNSLQFAELVEIPLGDSPFVLYVPGDFRQGTLNPEDVMDGQVAYWYSEASLLDFDVYQFSKEGLPEALAEYAEDEASEYHNVTEVVTDGEINLIPVAWYRTVEEYEDGEYDTITYIVDDGDEYVEVVFWLDGLTAEAEADYIINNLIDTSLGGEQVG